MNLIEAIAERRARLEVLSAEYDALNDDIVRLEKAKELVEGILAGPSMKPPPRAEKTPVRKAPAPRTHRATGHARTQPGDKHFARCRHPNTAENQTSQGRCKTCAKAAQQRWQEKHARKTVGGHSPKTKATKAEPDPVRLVEVVADPPAAALVLTEAERAKLLKLAKPGASRTQRAKAEEILEKGEKRAELAAEVKAAIAPPTAVTAAGAAKWQKQCTLLNFEDGKRCSLLQGHQGLHSASGRTFATGLNPSDLGGTLARPSRELDAVALRGRSDA